MAQRQAELADLLRRTNMTNEERQDLYTEVNELLDIYNEFSPCQPDGKSVTEAVKPCITEMIDYIMKDSTEAASM